MIRVWKIWDKDCPICAEMSKFDRAEIHGRAGYYRELLLSDVTNNGAIRDYLKENVVTDEGTIDIPVYVVEWRGVFVGWLQGQMDRATFRKELVSIISQRKSP